MASNNTIDFKILTKKLAAGLGAIDKKALDLLAIISYLKKNPDLDEAAKQNIGRWESNLLRVRSEV
jgi:hypothetical protein